MMRCVNCAGSKATTTLTLQARLARWLNNQLPLDACICHPCFNLLNTKQADNERLIGHTMVCRGCGLSVRGLRFYIIPADSLLLPNISHDDKQDVATTYACRVCWTRANRHVIQDSSWGSQENVTPSMPGGSPLSPPPPPPPQPPVPLPQPAHTASAYGISLPNYKRDF